MHTEDRAQSEFARASNPAPPHQVRRRHWLLGWPLKALLSIALVAALAFNIDWPRLRQSLASADRFLLAAALVVFAFTVPAVAERWRASARAVNIQLGHGFCLRATYASVFAGQFLPAGVGVDAARLAFLWHQRIPLRLAFQSIIIDRIAGLAAIFLLMFGGLPFVFRLLPSSAAVPVTGTALLLLAAGATGLFADRLLWADRFQSGQIGKLLALMRDTRGAVATKPALTAFGCAIGIQVLVITSILLIARAFGHVLSVVDLLTVVSFAIFASLLPISMNGWGIREGAMVLGLSLLGVNRETALLISFLFGVGGALVALPGALFWHRMKAPQRPQ
jgi:glycosyltransferase 2 family protein